MAADALVSLGVVVAGALYVRTQWQWLDPVTSLVVAAVVMVGTWALFRQSLHLMLDGVPDTIELGQVEAYLRSLLGVENLHDLHVWATSTSGTALTAHLVVPTGNPGPEFFANAAEALHERFGITHPTMQIETASLGDDCAPLAERSPSPRPTAPSRRTVPL
jgi:cobalt-zinc-cadmium efflux system protein